MKQCPDFIQRYSQRLVSSALIGLLTIGCMDHNIPNDPPPTVVNCKLHNGMDRPYPCEFIIEQLIVLGNDGSTLGIITPGSPNVALSLAKAKKKSGNNNGGSVTYDIKAVVRRQNAPSFAVNAGYILSYAYVSLPLQSDPRPVTNSSQAFPMGIGATQEVSFELSFAYSIQGAMIAPEFGPRSFFIENDVTTTKFAFNSSVPVVDKAEASITINPGFVL